MLTLASRYGGFISGKKYDNFQWFGGAGFSSSASNTRLTVTPSQITAAASPGGNGGYWQTGIPLLSEAKTEGKWWWEVEPDDSGGGAGYPFAACGIGITTGITTPMADGQYFGNTLAGLACILGVGVQVNSVTQIGTTPAFYSGSRMGFAVDIDLGYIWIRGGGAVDWWNSLDPSGSPWATFTPRSPIIPYGAGVGDNSSLGANVQYFYNTGSFGLP